MTADHYTAPFDRPADEISLTPTGYRPAHPGPKANLGRGAMASDGDWAQRIGRHILPDGRVAVPPRIAAWLKRQATLTNAPRISVRDSDPLAYEVLAALHIAALSPSSGSGSKVAERQHRTQELETWMSTSTAAVLLGVTDRAIRKRITTGKLPATRHGSRWLINRNHLQALALSA
ncbi:MAG: helix-turn-helix domain-containing protein [Mycobacterium sp.]|nr:helix-turn-helix domain-containing protein [Mycobacterium sp.]